MVNLSTSINEIIIEKEKYKKYLIKKPFGAIITIKKIEK
jgi:hypothetical protein